jgi:hypothetical protein
MVAALFAVAILVKLYDLFRHPELAQRLPLSSYIAYLANWFWLVLPKEPARAPRAEDLQRLRQVIPPLLVMLGACWLVSLNYSDVPFAIEHTVKVSALVATIILLANGAAQVWRLLGGRALDPMLDPLLATTPADFWRRWNRPAQQFFQEYAYGASGGFRRPVRGILVSFIASGVVHEYLFAITIGRVMGWQLLYFALHGLATVATFRIRPRGWMVIPCVAGTIAFNLVMSILFFKSVDFVLPFYSR